LPVHKGGQHQRADEAQTSTCEPSGCCRYPLEATRVGAGDPGVACALVGELAYGGRGALEPAAERLQSATGGARELTVDEPPLAGGEPAVGRCGMVWGAVAPIAQPKLAHACCDAQVRTAEAQGKRAWIHPGMEAEQGVLLSAPPSAGARRRRLGSARHTKRSCAPANRLRRAPEQLRDLDGGAQRC
jgi:hypothetical protein